ncbi:MAG: type VI secretion system baseplate subunit TssK [Fulvimonas sp.]|nr:type VI secretion system baseplate subunit TssK [Fulvimonas sp.]
MSHTAKLFWGEGLFLRPQHFQRQDAYHEARLHEMSQALHPYGWGVRSVRFDNQSLATGMLRPLQLSVIFPDGELYNAPDADELPPPLSLESLPAGTQEVTVYLALPQLKEYGGNCAQGPGDATARYLQQNVQTPDVYSDAAEAELAYLKKSVRLLTQEQPRDAFVTVPLIRLRRRSTGGFEPDPVYLPPSVSLRAVPMLFLQLRRLLDALQAKAQALYGLHREPSQHIIEFRSGDVASFWLLHTANSAFAALAHFYQHPGLAPERLFQELLRLAGALLTFSPAYELSDLPAYEHGDPGPGFDKLFRIIRELIDTVISARYFGIALTEVRPSYYLGRIDSQRIDEKSAFYLAVGAALPATELVSIVPVRFKVGAPDDVEKAVLSALPGVGLSHAPQIPAAIPVRPGSTYFAIEARGPLYERMLKSQSIMIYVPAGIPELKLELIALTP